jgi:pimeloyl-ACP methyl ester carboxylesterase
MDNLILGALCLFLGRSLVHAIPLGNITKPTTLTYPGETITWIPCGNIDNRLVECGNLTVPMDHFNATNNLPDNKHFNIALVRLRSPDPNATVSMFLNPGGPGGSGTSQIFSSGATLSAILGDAPGTPHLLGFDPRGINLSTPLASCMPPSAHEDAELRYAINARAGSVRARKPLEDSGELWAWTRARAQACADAMGPHGAYINTPQTAADMAAILDALGQEKLYYWGFSYGTLLGATFATMYPDRVERMIIDGVANQFDWYNKQLDREMMADTDRVLFGFAEECVKAGTPRCALAELAETGQELFDLILTELIKLRDDPISVYVDNTTYGVLDYWSVFHDGIFQALYQPAANWAEMAQILAALFKGDPTLAFNAWGRSHSGDSIEDGYTFVTYNDGASGPETWNVTNRHELVDYLLPFFNESLFGEGQLEYYFSKQAWAIPRTHTYKPCPKVHTHHPLLVLSTTYDPVTPLVSARKARDTFPGSQLVEIKGYGHCSLAVPSTCAAQYIRDYVRHGKLPEKEVQCEGDGDVYFPELEETALRLRDVAPDDDEARLRAAQLELAKEKWPSMWKFR